jgi:two-component system chemotaxis sensor kinase CheA
MGKLYERLWSVFVDEARAKLDEMNDALSSMSAGTDDREVRETLRRGAHTLKGNAAAMEFGPVADLAGQIESAALALRDRPERIANPVIEVLREAVAAMAGFVERFQQGALVVEPVGEQLSARLLTVRRDAVQFNAGV